ncbi:hypothetical protein IAR55_000806 [Kwoniella newhampshirensis]|uniref:Mediator of RNA polymerase II transcription subunit 19 n=1 Tax=Kwoniella newhampshirensis TaxID=1651941 RepID=A0AAW0Z408_9TREE
MDSIQNGESSRSPRPNGVANGTVRRDMDVDMDGGETQTKTELILPQWDIPPPRPLHASLDLISLLHLDELYNTYVRPFADFNSDEANPVQGQGQGQDGEGGTGAKGQRKKGQFRKKMEKGYQHLIEDCIDPTPLGTKGDNHSLLPLIPDLMHPPAGPPPGLFSGPMEIMSADTFKVARLEAGMKQDGYAGGTKAGVKEAEERRRRRRIPKAATTDPALPSPGGAPSPSIAHLAHPLSTPTPGTPLLPVLPPYKPNFSLIANRKPTIFPSQQGARPFPTSGPGSASGPGNPNSNGNGSGNANGQRRYSPHKRPGSSDLSSQNGQQKKRAKTSGVGSRSASPMPLPPPPSGQIQGGMGPAGNRMKPSMRGKTEG